MHDYSGLLVPHQQLYIDQPDGQKALSPARITFSTSPESVDGQLISDFMINEPGQSVYCGLSGAIEISELQVVTAPPNVNALTKLRSIERSRHRYTKRSASYIASLESI